MTGFQPKCPNCGAALDPAIYSQPNPSCRFCGSALAAPPPAGPPPGGYGPPPGAYGPPPGAYGPPPGGYAPPPFGAAAPGQITYQMPSGSSAGAVIGGIGALIGLVVAIVVVFSTMHLGCSKVPMACGPNGHVHLSGKTYSGKGPLVDEGANCEILIEDCHLKSDVVIRPGPNGHVTIVRSVIEGSEVGLDLSGGNAEVKIDEKSEIRGKIAIKGGPNAHVEVVDSKVIGTDVAFAGDANAELKATHSEIKGESAAADLGVNGKVVASASQIIGATRGVHGRQNAHVELRDDASITAHEFGIDAGENAEIMLVKGKVDGAVAIKAGGNFHLEADQSTVKGGEGALQFGSNANLKLENATIEAKGIAMKGDRSIQIEARGSTIGGGKAALVFPDKPNENFTNTKIHGAEEYGGSSAATPAAAAPAAADPGKADLHKHKHKK